MERYTKNTTVIIVLILLFAGHVNLASAAIIYVNQAAAGSNNGSSWSDAYVDLQSALNVAVSDDDIWVASGTYMPSVEVGGTGSRYQTFQMINGVTIYGGFAGNEDSATFDLADRDFVTNETFLSGDIGVLDDPSDNCYHVFFHPDGTNLDDTAILDGFTITDGNADHVDWPHDSGGGMFNDASSPTVTNCIFSDNSAYLGGGVENDFECYSTLNNCTFSGNTASYGGAIYNYSSSPTVTNSTFSGNSASVNGGCIANETTSNPIVTGCTFNGNAADTGGGAIDNFDNCSPVVTNCTFNGNAAENGGGMNNDEYCSPIVTNCIFSGNIASAYGGGMENVFNSDPNIINCTFSNNTADIGGAMDNYENNPEILNSIFWGNMVTSFDNEISIDTSVPFIANCDIQGGLPAGSDDGGGNINADPLFVDADGPDNVAGTEDDDLQLQDGSPCINTADNNAVPAGVTTDLNNAPRIVGGDVDMGAYENQTDTSSLTVTSPMLNELWAKGRTYQIEWVTGNPSPNVKIQLFKGNSKVMGIKNPTENDGSHSWKIPSTVAKGTNYRIKVICINEPTVYDFSDSFEVVGLCDLYTPIEVTDPGSATDWEMGQTYSIQWTGGEIGQNVKIKLFKGSNLMKTITASTANDGEHDFSVPYNLPPGTNYRIKVVVLNTTCSSLKDMSDYFTINVPSVDVSLPDNSTTWMMGDTNVPINWSGTFPGNVKIKLLKGNTVVKTISNGTPNDGTHMWSKVLYSLPPRSNYRVKIISTVNNKINAFSDYFAIAIPPINVVDPSGSTEWRRGHIYPVRWTGGKPGAYVRIRLLKGGVAIKTIKSSTINDGLHNWTVPTGLALDTDYRIEVIYLPNTAMRDTSDAFAVINSPVGTWVGKWFDGPDSGPLKLVIKNNETLTGKFTTGGIGVPFSGTYTYDFATGEFLCSASGIKKINGRPKYRVTLVTSGDCVNNEMTGLYSGSVEKKISGIWQPYEDLDGAFIVNR